MSDSGPWIVAEVIEMAGIMNVGRSDIRCYGIGFLKRFIDAVFRKIEVERVCVEEKERG